MDEVIRTYQDSVAPAVRVHRGSRGGLVLTDRSTGKLIAISLWETEADMSAAERPRDVDAITGEPPVQEIYEVSAQEPSPGGGEATYAGVNYSQVQPGKMDEYVSILRDSVAPATRQMRGFKGGLWLTDPNTGKRLSIGLWETEADMRAFVSSGSQQEGRAKTDHLMAGPRTREVYEVSIQV